MDSLRNQNQNLGFAAADQRPHEGDVAAGGDVSVGGRLLVHRGLGAGMGLPRQAGLVYGEVAGLGEESSGENSSTWWRSSASEPGPHLEQTQVRRDALPHRQAHGVSRNQFPGQQVLLVAVPDAERKGGVRG